jgi:hypothetical protein
VIQFRLDKPDGTGLTTRKFGYVHQAIGTALGFANCRPDPTGRWLWCLAPEADGVRSEIVALRIENLPPEDTQNRTTFVPIRIDPACTGITNIRAIFGYAENGDPASGPKCSAYSQCSTEIPSGAATDPFAFTNEAVTRKACGSFTIPALPDRMLYYRVEGLDGSGNVIRTGPTQIVAVP